jgi:hypothetical protein
MTHLRHCVWTALILTCGLPAIADEDPGLPPPNKKAAERSFEQLMLATSHVDFSATTLMVSADGGVMLIETRADGAADPPFETTTRPGQLAALRRALARIDVDDVPPLSDEPMTEEVETHMVSAMGEDLALDVIWKGDAELQDPALRELVRLLETIRRQTQVKAIPLPTSMRAAVQYRQIHPQSGDAMLISVARDGSVKVTTLTEGGTELTEGTLNPTQAGALNATIVFAERHGVPQTLLMESSTSLTQFSLRIDADEEDYSVDVTRGQLERLGDHEEALGPVTKMLRVIADQVRAESAAETAPASDSKGIEDVLEPR